MPKVKVQRLCTWGLVKLNGMTRKTLLSDADKREIAGQYANGAGIVQLARAYSCRTSQINSAIEASGTARKMLTASTPIECRLHDALKAAGIGFTTQKRLVGRYVVDISIHQAPVVIEADGARHHAGTKAQERDTLRDAAHEAAGYRMFRFSGSEINADAVKCIQKLIDACGLVPDKEPVYDIRTKFSGADHPRHVGMYELTCGYCGETFLNRRSKRMYCSHEHYILGVQKGKPKSAEVRAALAESNRRRVWTDEARAKVSASRVGKPTTKGRPKSAEHRAKISAALTGQRQSDETRAKKSASHRGKTMDEPTRAKISAALTGRKRSNQTKIESEPA